MNIDLSLLHSNTVDKIDISGNYTIPLEYFKDSSVVGLDDVIVRGSVTRREDEDGELEDYIECAIDGVMKIPDSISLEVCDYKYSIFYDDILEENCKKNENTLDIFQFLWENIVLEVPIVVSKDNEVKTKKGEFWEVRDENSKKDDPRLECFRTLLDEGKE